MKNTIIFALFIPLLLLGCGERKSSNVTEQTAVVDSVGEKELKFLSENLKPVDVSLPTIGILMYDNVLMTELTAPIDVFAKHSEDGRKLFNVITIAQEYKMFTCEEGLKMFPDYTFANAPKLEVLIVPSSYDMTSQINNKELVEFIKDRNNYTNFTVSNCAGATLIGESGIADGRKIVTWVGGGVDLQKNYPNLIVQDDSKISYVEDGKFLSSNGNLASYISSLELLEKLTNRQHRHYVESQLYLDRLQKWNKK